VRCSVNQITTYRATLEEELSALSEAGFRAIGLWRRKLDETGLHTALDLIRESGIEVTSLSFAGGFTGSTGWTFREAMDDAVEALFTAAAVGARCLVIAPGSRGRYTARHEQRVVAQSVRELAAIGSELGVRLAIMPRRAAMARRWTSLESLHAAIDLVQCVGRERLGIVLDTFQFGTCPVLCKDPGQVAPYVEILQLSDAPTDAACEDQGCLPGDGTLPLADILAGMLASGFDGDIDLQVWSRDLWNQPLNYVIPRCRVQLDAVMAESVSIVHQSATA